MLNASKYFEKFIFDAKNGSPRSICSVCSSNRLVIEAALEEGVRTGNPVLIEATANQANQFGGYTGMKPGDFAEYVYSIADKAGFNRDMLILGGDHLGPLVWSNEPEAAAMDKAETLVTEYAAAGFSKLHLDCSMRLGDDDRNLPLSAETVAERAARLALAAEKVSAGKPVYVIGSEVPIPGGATEAEDDLSITRPEDLKREYAQFKSAFLKHGLADAWERVIAIVVQPGVEFGDDQIFLYNGVKAAKLTAAARELPHTILEGHSTDYQPGECLCAMKNDGVGILKVGPALTFAAREAIYALEKIERTLYRSEPEDGYSNFEATLERVMLESPANWERHYHGDEEKLALMRRYSLSDRSRYYMENAAVKAALDRLTRNIDNINIPLGLLSQYLPGEASEVIAGKLEKKAEALIKEHICYFLRSYG